MTGPPIRGGSLDLPVRLKKEHEVKREDGTVVDLVETYNNILAHDHDVSMPVAAIEAMIDLLSHMTSTTLAETIDIIEGQIAHLTASVPNPIPPVAGARLFRRFLSNALTQPTSRGDGTEAGAARVASSSKMTIDDVRQYLVRHSRSFAAAAKAARVAIADMGARYVRPGTTVLTTGGSRCVKQMLLRAADVRAALHGSPDFRVIYVMDGSADSEPAVAQLRARGVDVATVDGAACAHVMKVAKVDRVFVGAEAVCQRGGVISRMGTYQLALITKNLRKDIGFFVVTETHKFSLLAPMDQADVTRMGVKQKILNFKGAADGKADTKDEEDLWRADYTPPELIKGFITEQGTKTPESILEFVLRINGF